MKKFLKKTPEKNNRNIKLALLIPLLWFIAKPILEKFGIDPTMFEGLENGELIGAALAVVIVIANQRKGEKGPDDPVNDPPPGKP